MRTLVACENKEFIELLESVDEDLGRDEESLNLFEWVVEDYYEAKMNESLEYFIDRPDLMEISVESYTHELGIMMNYFIGKEEYEKCARILIIQNTLFKTEDNYSIL